MGSIARALPAIVSLAWLCATGMCPGKTLGLYRDESSGITDGMLRTLREAGWQVTMLTAPDLANEAKLAGMDVVFLPGGNNVYDFADFNARRSLVKYAAGGKGILAGAFRGGYVRTANRPLFPQVAEVYNKVNGSTVVSFGDSELAKAIDQPFFTGGRDHGVLKVGPLGTVFAVSPGDNAPIGAHGSVYGGRYIVFAAPIGMAAATNAMDGTSKQALLKMLDWLAAAPKLGEVQKAAHQAQALLDFLRREKTMDWTLNGRGPDRAPGILPAIRNRHALVLQSRQYTLQHMSQYLSGKDYDRCMAAEGDLRRLVKQLDENYSKAAADMADRISRMAITDLTVDRSPQSRDAYVEQLMPAARMKAMTAVGDNAIAELRPIVAAAKAAKRAAERARDLAAVPGLIGKCAAPEASARRAAASELGRIGSPDSAPALVKLLKDEDGDVRVEAIIALGWLQAKEAVPDLIAHASGNDPRMRRRAVQALGQIGDSRAIAPLLGMLADKDYFVRENAILALGWLKAKEAVPELLKIASTFDRRNAGQRGLMVSAIRALGHIGDPAALPAIQSLAKIAMDQASDMRNNRVNYLSSPLSPGLEGHAGPAAAEIMAGGLPEPGIKQAAFLSASAAFHGLTRDFNALAGRPDSFTGGDMALLWPYLWEAGMTGVNAARGAGKADEGKFLEIVRAAGDLDLRWINPLPMGGNKTYSQFRAGADKNDIERVLMAFKDEPAFSGFWSEEAQWAMPASSAGFTEWLEKRHGPGFRKKLGAAESKDPLELARASESTAGGSTPLKAEYMLYCAETLLDSLREAQEWMRGFRKGCAFAWSGSGGGTFSLPGVPGRAGSVIDLNGPEENQCFGRHNTFLLEMCKDGEPRPVMGGLRNWYSPSPEHDVRGFAQHLAHGECFFNYDISQVFEQASEYPMWAWDASRWARLRKIFRKARAMREYVAVPESGANVALVLSGLSCASFYPSADGQDENRWLQHQVAMWTALSQSHIPSDIIWAETLTPGKLRRYRVLVLAGARIVTEEQAEILREWVNAGGVLIACGAASLYDHWALQRKDYLLSGLFGLGYVDNIGVADPAKIDTYCLGRDGAAAKAVSGPDQENFARVVCRGIKPVKSLGLYKAADKASALLPGVAAGTACEYDMPLGYDKVKPGTAEVLASFANGDPALTVNKAGNGLCYFWTPVYPGLCHLASEWEATPNKYDFWPNVRELLAAMVRGGLEYRKASLPIEVSGISKEVEVTVRRQPEQNRLMVHLLDFDTKSSRVQGAKIFVNPPDGKTIKRIFHPDTGLDVAFEAAGSGVSANLRGFESHDMVVVQY